MTGLLVSVRDAAEARVALAAGVNVIDVKEPRRGPLGSASVETAIEICRVVAGRASVSVSLGELSEDGAENVAEWARIWNDLPLMVRPRYMKLGLARCGAAVGGSGVAAVHASESPTAAGIDTVQQDRWRETLSLIPRSVVAVAVAYADWRAASSPAPQTVLELAAALGCQAILVDTYDKDGPGLTELWTVERCTSWVYEAHRRTLIAVLAGKLRETEIARLIPAGADYLAVRSAACHESRGGQLDASRVERLMRHFSPLLFATPY